MKTWHWFALALAVVVFVRMGGLLVLASWLRGGIDVATVTIGAPPAARRVAAF